MITICLSVSGHYYSSAYCAGRDVAANKSSNPGHGVKSLLSSHEKYASQDKLRLMIHVHSNTAYWIWFNNSKMKYVHLPITTWLGFYPTQIKDLTRGLQICQMLLFLDVIYEQSRADRVTE